MMNENMSNHSTYHRIPNEVGESLYNTDPLSSGDNVSSNYENERYSPAKFVEFWSMKIIITLTAFTCFICFILLLYYRGGLAFTSESTFNFHVLFMIIGLHVMLPLGALAFRFSPDCPRSFLKASHAVIMGAVTISLLIGFYSIYTSKNLSSNPHLRSLHSWLGITIIFSFVTQFAIAFIAFVYPGLNLENRIRVKVIHVFFGKLLIILAIITSMIGYGHHFAKKSPESEAERFIVNFMGISIIISGIGTCLILK